MGAEDDVDDLLEKAFTKKGDEVLKCYLFNI